MGANASLMLAVSERFPMDELNLALVRVLIDVGLLSNHFILESTGGTAHKNDEPSLRCFGVVVYCGVNYALVLTCARFFYDYYQDKGDVPTSQLVQHYQSGRWTRRAKIICFDEKYDLCLLKLKRREHDDDRYTSALFSESGVSVLDPVIFMTNWMHMTGKVSNVNLSKSHLPNDSNFVHGSSIVNKYAEDMKLIQCDYHFDSKSWGGPVYDSNHGEIIGIHVACSHGFRYGFAVCCSSIKSFLCNNFPIPSQVIDLNSILRYIGENEDIEGDLSW